MSAEVAQTPREDTASSSAVEKDLSDPHSQSSSAISPPSPGKSILTEAPLKTMLAAKLTMNSDTFTTPSLSPTSYKSATEVIPQEEADAIIKRVEDSPATGDAVTVPIETNTGLQTAGEGGPGIPLRSSSNSQAQTLTSVPAPEKTSDELKSVSRRASKDSIKEKSRSGSLASRISKREKSSGPGLATQEKQRASPQVEPSTIAKPKKGFLSFLNCCGSSNNANIEATEPAVVPRKANVLQPNRSRQPTPLVKANRTEGDSSVSESKDVPEETIGGTPYGEQTAAEKPKMITRRSKEAVISEKTTASQIGSTSEKQMAQQGSTGDSSLPPLPVVGTSSPAIVSANQEPLSSTQGNASVLPPNPPQAIPAEESVAAQGEVINDRTLQQEQSDSDIAMTEAPPIAPEVEDSSRSAEPQTDERPTQIALPPPPPRDNQARPTAQGDRGPTAERQQWLLPPIQPHFRGKKCLVLDLDETLVHSSFKVRDK